MNHFAECCPHASVHPVRLKQEEDNVKVVVLQLGGIDDDENQDCSCDCPYCMDVAAEQTCLQVHTMASLRTYRCCRARALVGQVPRGEVDGACQPVDLGPDDLHMSQQGGIIASMIHMLLRPQTARPVCARKPPLSPTLQVCTLDYVHGKDIAMQHPTGDSILQTPPLEGRCLHKTRVMCLEEWV